MNCLRIAMVNFLSILISAATAFSEEPWDVPAFTASTAEIMTALKSQPAPKHADVEVLLDEVTCVFDRNGSSQRTRRRVYRFLTEDAVEYSAVIRASYSPWRHQERPTMRARVINIDGKVYHLDPKTIGESATPSSLPNIFSDVKSLHAPLPAAAVNAVVEEEIITRESHEFCENGVIHRVPLVSYSPTRKIRLIIDAPTDMPLSYVVRGSSAEPKRTERDGRVRLVFETEPIMQGNRALSFVAPHGNPARVIFSNGDSWANIARHYSNVVEKRIDQAAVQSIVKGELTGGETRDEAAAKLLAKLHATVRYTGLEFGDATIIPRTPAETLKRRYGDCKDQSLLLVTMLRMAGIEAHMALLRAGADRDLERTVEGFNAFNHAIVYLPGDRPLWIDPTVEFIPIGQLPNSDQGRWALVASPTTEDLIRTPISRAQANRSFGSREYQLLHDGTGRVLEINQANGAQARRVRDWLSRSSEKERMQAWKSYARSEYGGKLVKADVIAADDLSKPLQVRFKIEDVHLATLKGNAMTMLIESQGLFAELPYELTMPVEERFEEKKKRNAATGDDKKKKRTLKVFPHVLELHYRVVPPAGFKLRDVPKNETSTFGPATITRKFEVDDQQVLDAKLRFSTGNGRFTDEEAMALRTHIAESNASPETSRIDVIYDKQPGKQPLSLQIAKFEKIRQLLRRDPEDGLVRGLYARALLEAGFGETARRQAQRAVELAPDSASAQLTLAEVMSHDKLGRRLQSGMNRKSALSAYRKALELDPSNLNTRWNLAILLEFDTNGFRYSEGGSLESAIRQYEKVRKQNPTHERLNTNFMYALLSAKRFEQLRDVTESLEPSHMRNSMLLAAVVAAEGVDAGLAYLPKMAKTKLDRRNFLWSAGTNLKRARHYDEARAVLNVALKENPDHEELKSTLQALIGLHRHEEALFPEDDPRRVVQELYIAVMKKHRRADVRSLFVDGTDDDACAGYVDELADHQIGQGARMRKNSVSPQRAADSMSFMKLTAKGDDDSGYQINAWWNVLPDTVWFVVKRDGGYRLVDAGPGRWKFGAEALRLLDKGDAATARVRLDWAATGRLKGLSIFKQFEGSPFARFWASASKDDPASIRLGAAALLAESKANAAKTIEILRAGQKDAKALGKLQIERAILQAYSNSSQLEDLVTVADQFMEKYPSAEEGWRFKALAFQKLGDVKQMRGLLQERIDRYPKDPWGLYMLGQLEGEAGQFQVAEKLLRRYVATKDEAIPLALNSLAWIALFHDKASETALEDALAANEATGYSDDMMLHTLATIYAELGEIEKARDFLGRSVDGRRAGIAHQDYYVIGRIAEHLGLKTVARNAFGKVQPPTIPISNSTHVLAQRRLEALAASSPDRSGDN